ncbi:uncharacterized protein LOC136025352 isoform X2 [Artemia franciscana]|uniref:uncharacterized protein LOC136025352 isoform X2 n=1 Tax=Artemia franciscana TaxID=6661 RepID=UPI0032DBBAB2
MLKVLLFGIYIIFFGKFIICNESEDHVRKLLERLEESLFHSNHPARSETNLSRAESEELKDYPVCFLPPETGPCNKIVTRYYFDPAFGKCLPFNYGGCGGNINNFKSPKFCHWFCNDYTRSVESTANTTSSPIQSAQEPSRCPPIPLGVVHLVSTNSCASDNDCPYELLCCFNGGGKECLEPIMKIKQHPLCPKPFKKGYCTDKCSDDSSCHSGTVCCFSGCGMECLQPKNICDWENSSDKPFHEAPHRPSSTDPESAQSSVWYNVKPVIPAITHEERNPMQYIDYEPSPPYRYFPVSESPPVGHKFKPFLQTLVEAPYKNRHPHINDDYSDEIDDYDADFSDYDDDSNEFLDLHQRVQVHKPLPFWIQKHLRRNEMREKRLKTRPNKHFRYIEPGLAFLLHRRRNQVFQNRIQGKSGISSASEVEEYNLDDVLKTYNKICTLPPIQGNISCAAIIPMWTYNATLCVCQKYIYGGCRGTENLFESRDECVEKCNPCNLPVDKGKGNSTLKRYAYDKNQSGCVPFDFNGYGGNDNNFNSIDECKFFCDKNNKNST